MPCLGDQADRVRSGGAYHRVESAPLHAKRQKAGWCAALRAVPRLVQLEALSLETPEKETLIGAAGGALLGTVRRNDQIRQEEHAHQQWAQQNVAQYEQNTRSNSLRFTEQTADDYAFEQSKGRRGRCEIHNSDRCMYRNQRYLCTTRSRR